MRIDKFTTKFQQALADAQSLANGNDQQFIEPQHLLLALINQDDGGTTSLLARAGEFVEAGLMTGASGRNWASYGDKVSLAAGLDSSAQTLLSDPQTSGGLLVSCAPDTVTEVLSLFLQHGFTHVSVIGEMAEGEPGIAVV